MVARPDDQPRRTFTAEDDPDNAAPRLASLPEAEPRPDFVCIVSSSGQQQALDRSGFETMLAPITLGDAQRLSAIEARETASELRGRNVVILHTTDKDCQMWAATVARAVYDQAKSVKLVRLKHAEAPDGNPAAIYAVDGGALTRLLPRFVQVSRELTESNIDSDYRMLFRPDRPPRFRLKTFAEMKAKRPPAWLIDDLIPERSISMLYGPPGSGKTFLAMDWIMHLNAGTRVHSCRRDVMSPQQGVYILGEGGGQFGNRVRAWEAGNGISADDPICLEDMPRFMNPGDVDELIESLLVAGIDPGFIVIDTLARATPGANESASDDMGVFVANIERLRTEMDCAVLVIHHAGKANEKTYRGSGALEGAMDMIFRIDMDDDGHGVLRCEKAKDSPKFAPIHVARVSIPIESEVTEDETSCYLVSTEPKSTPETVFGVPDREALDYLAANEDHPETTPGDRGLFRKEWSSGLGRAESSFDNSVKTLIKLGLIERFRKPGDNVRVYYRTIKKDDPKSTPELPHGGTGER